MRTELYNKQGELFATFKWSNQAEEFAAEINGRLYDTYWINSDYKQGPSFQQPKTLNYKIGRINKTKKCIMLIKKYNNTTFKNIEEVEKAILNIANANN